MLVKGVKANLTCKSILCSQAFRENGSIAREKRRGEPFSVRYSRGGSG